LIIDSSTICAILMGEDGWQRLKDAIDQEPHIVIPAPVLTETNLVLGGRGPKFVEALSVFIDTMIVKGVTVIPFEQRHADITTTARERYGKGNGRGGMLNFGDLMVYAVAKDRGEPLLCTGADFASTDLELHPASRGEVS
jgi:ribonuclease VapC